MNVRFISTIVAIKQFSIHIFKAIRSSLKNHFMSHLLCRWIWIILGTCLASYGLGFALAPAWPSSPGLIAAVIVMSLGNGLGAGINMTIGADLSPSTGRAQFLSVWAMFTQGGAVCGPLVISGLLLVSSLPLAMAAMGALSGAGAVWTAVVARTAALPGRRRRA